MARRWSWGRKTTAETKEVAAATAYHAASVRRWARRKRDGAKRRAGTRSRAATVRKIALSAASDTMNCTADLQGPSISTAKLGRRAQHLSRGLVAQRRRLVADTHVGTNRGLALVQVLGRGLQAGVLDELDHRRRG